MTETTPAKPTSDDEIRDPEMDKMEEYAGGTIQAWHGFIPGWLVVVYAVLFIWGLYYAYYYWGGVGPGRVD